MIVPNAILKRIANRTKGAGRETSVKADNIQKYEHGAKRLYAQSASV